MPKDTHTPYEIANFFSKMPDILMKRHMFVYERITLFRLDQVSLTVAFRDEN